MIIELCASDYVTSNGLMNGIDGIFKSSTTHNEKTIIYWIMFQIFRIKTLTRKKIYYYYYNKIQSKWTPIEHIIKDITVNKTQSFIITKI
jgi:hypothetical protein